MRLPRGVTVTQPRKLSGLFRFESVALYFKTAKLECAVRVPRGVTVTQRPLEALFMVQIHAG